MSSQIFQKNVGMWEWTEKCGIFPKNVGISGKMWDNRVFCGPLASLAKSLVSKAQLLSLQHRVKAVFSQCSKAAARILHEEFQILKKIILIAFWGQSPGKFYELQLNLTS